MDNRELVQLLGLESLQQDFADRSGPRSRFYAQNGQGPSDLAMVAATSALREAGISSTDVDFLIFATMTPDVTFPGAGCYLQHKLGCGTVGALDLRAQCSGFLFALEIADQFVRAGAYRRVLVAAGDVHSSALDFSPSGVDVTPLFGDGAAACVVSETGAEIIEIVLHTDATDFDRFWCEFPSSRRRPTRFMTEDLARKRHHPTLDREFVRRDGLERIRSTVMELLERSSTPIDRVTMFFLQHVYRDTALEAAEALRISNRATVGGLDEAHVASASLPIALSRARESGAVKAGDLICLATAGAGMTSSAALLRL